MSDQPQGDTPVAEPKSTPTQQSEAVLVCPECGSSNFHVEKGLLLWCHSCGRSTAPWAYQDDEHAKLAKAYAIRSGAVVPGRKIHVDSPRCSAKRQAANGDYIECGGRSWQHDGTRLMYCRHCGVNYTGGELKNIRAIIDTMGPASPSTRTPQQLTKRSPEEFGDGASRTQPGVDLEEYRAHSQE